VKNKFINSTHNLPVNHRKRFENRLKNELHAPKKNKFNFIKVAASIIILLGFIFLINHNLKNKVKVNKTYTLGSLSPELEKIENYYTNAITYELAQLDLNDDNKLILNKYLNKLAELTKQYKEESAQLNIDKISEETINALIDNLQLRLQLLLQLKEQLKTIKNKKNENNKI
jgi:hypothetical protein